jgi:hypothetical protein
MSCYVYDAELEAMHAVLKAVEHLTHEERERVFEWVSNRVGFLIEKNADEARIAAFSSLQEPLAEVA